MTIWRAGMAAVCIHGGGWRAVRPVRIGIFRWHRRSAGPARGQVVRVAAVLVASNGVYLQLAGFAARNVYHAAHFRPLIDTADDAGLVARIKACKPAHVEQPA
ncbi:MAG: hypothetical protein BGP16_05405 [Sphingobium sp. 66-54]|nr:MAG: hypothetical protein BGP16_05405 [Sphingobium sp. 66-54]